MSSSPALVGAALGLERAGFEHAALVEWDAAACATLRAAGLGPVVEGDVRDLDRIAATVGPEPVGLLWSSFPCQAFSQAGKRLGASDERNGWPWTVAAVDRFRPTWLLAENVRGLLSHSGEHCGDPQRCPGCYFEGVILPELRERFAFVGWWLLDAADYGVPQHRRRVIIWAGPAPVERPEPTHGPETGRPWVSMKAALIDGPCVACGGSGVLQSPLGLPSRCGRCSVNIGGARFIGGGRNPQAAGVERTYRDITDEPSTTVAAAQIGNAGPWVVAAGETGEGRPRSMDRAAPAIGTKGTAYLLRPAPSVCGGHSGKGCGQVSASSTLRAAIKPELIVATGRRRLTVEECARLQDFPSLHPWQGTKTARYAQVGNAVPPALADACGRAVIRAAKNLQYP